VRSSGTDRKRPSANSIQQARNIDGSLEILDGAVQDGAVLLVDDMVDSKWTLTVASYLLRRHGSGPVHPLALASPQPSPSRRGSGEHYRAVAPGGRMEMLSDRRNIVVIADEAHRSQYGFGGKVNTQTGEMSYGFASNLRDALPNASFIGFTGTPIEKTDANTRAVFGDYISIYDIQRAVVDKATVPIYHESRISKLSLNAAELPKLDAEFEEITEGEELTKKEQLKTKWAALEALVGDSMRPVCTRCMPTNRCRARHRL
jgi:hypothetical protein